MKKITITKQIILSSFLFLTIGTICAFSIPKPLAAIHQTVGINNGNDMWCAGNGICNVTLPENFNGNSFDAIGEFIIETDGSVTLKIKKESISVAKAEQQFGSKMFELNKDLELTPKLNEAVQSRGGRSKITKGSFPILEDKDHYIISF